MRPIRFLPLIFLLTACGVQSPTPLPTRTPEPIPSVTATIDWFPSTETPTKLPTVTRTPTPDLRPDLGEALLEDDFSDKENWLLPTGDDSSVAIVNNHLTLVLSRPNWFLYSLRKEPVFGDFYAEITASPNLCSGEDEYGVMVRVSPAFTYYRFVISCDGRAKVVRVSHSGARVIVPWESFAVIPAFAPSESRLAVWAVGEDIRFFINDQYLFSIRDTVLGKGTFGVFVRTSGETAISVNFSELVIRGVGP